MDKSNFLELKLPSRNNTTDVADINVISENFEVIDEWAEAVTGELAENMQTKDNMSDEIPENGAYLKEQYPSVGAVYNYVEYTKKETEALRIINSADGNSIALKDSSNLKLDNLKVFGKTKQNTTTGKNLLPSAINGTFTAHTNFVGVNLPSGTYTLSLNISSSGTDNYESLLLLINESGGSQSFNISRGSTLSRQTLTFTATSKIVQIRILAERSYDTSSGDTLVIAEAQIEKGTQATPYEQYTGGIPSPNPNYPQELKSVGDSGSFMVGVYGKNLFNITATTTTLNGVTFTVNADKSVTAVGTASITTTFTMGEFRNLIKGETYYAGGGLCCRLQLKDGTKRYVNSYNTFTYTDDIDRIYAYMSVGEGQTVNRTIYPMLSLGVTDETYEQYKVQTLTMPYTLRSVMGLPEEIDFTKGTRTNHYHSITINSMSGINVNTVGGATRFDIWGTPKAFAYWYGMCNRLTVSGTPAGTNATDNCICSHTSGAVFFRCDELANATDRETWLAEHPIHFIYRLATPIETPLTETELNAYRKLHTNKPNTTIISEAEMIVDYVADPKLYIDNKIAELTALTLEE